MKRDCFTYTTNYDEPPIIRETYIEYAHEHMEVRTRNPSSPPSTRNVVSIGSLLELNRLLVEMTTIRRCLSRALYRQHVSYCTCGAQTRTGGPPQSRRSCKSAVGEQWTELLKKTDYRNATARMRTQASFASSSIQARKTGSFIGKILYLPIMRYVRRKRYPRETTAQHASTQNSTSK